jgi:hypothetical protein
MMHVRIDRMMPYHYFLHCLHDALFCVLNLNKSVTYRCIQCDVSLFEIENSEIAIVDEDIRWYYVQ